MMYYVTKAKPIHFIDGKCHIKQLKKWKSHKTITWSISHHIMPLVSIMLSGVDTHVCTHIPMHEQKQFQETRCAAGLLTECPSFSIWEYFFSWS